jgi:hypothetical protein
MYLIRITGAVFLLAAWLFYRSARRASRRGWIGPRRRPIAREARPIRFGVAVAGECFGALVCLAAAYLCLTHAMTAFGGW